MRRWMSRRTLQELAEDRALGRLMHKGRAQEMLEREAALAAYQVYLSDSLAKPLPKPRRSS